MSPGQSSGTVVLGTMVFLEREHGGPRKTHSSDIVALVPFGAGTVRRCLWALHHVGLAEIADNTRGARAWRLTPAGREPFGLPNEHGAPRRWQPTRTTA